MKESLVMYFRIDIYAKNLTYFQVTMDIKKENDTI